MNKTKKLLIIFITVCLVGIISLSIYNTTYKKKETTPISTNEVTSTDKKSETKKSSEESSTTSKTDNDSTKSSSTDTKKEKSTETKKKSTDTTDQSKDTTKKTTDTKKSNTDTKKTETKKSTTTKNSTNQTSTTTKTNETKSEETISIHLSVVVPAEGKTLYNKTISVKKDTDARQILIDAHLSIKGSSYYVSGINSYNEKDHGPLSGWMYSVNGVKPNKAAKNYTLREGDTVKWEYVNYESD